MIELGKMKREIIRPLCEVEGLESPPHMGFAEGLADTVMVRGALEGSMGRVWVPELGSPSYCLIVLGDFAWLFGICPRGEAELKLRALLYEVCGRAFITPSDERWAQWLEETFVGEVRSSTRYAMKRDRNCFSESKLELYAASLPDGIRIRQMDRKLYHLALKEEWSRSFCSNFQSPEEFERDGLGFVALDGKNIVSGCSAYGVSQGLMEIEVRTRKEYMRKGLALACSARFILTCLENGIYPSWNAANQQSAELASRLGYLFDREYQVYQLTYEERLLLEA